MGGLRRMQDGSYADETLPIPLRTDRINMAITGTAAASASTALPQTGNILRIVNEGPNNLYLAVGVGTQAATVPVGVTPVNTCTPVMAGEDCSFSIANAQQNISIICRAGETCVAIVSVGEGV